MAAAPVGGGTQRWSRRDAPRFTIIGGTAGTVGVSTVPGSPGPRVTAHPEVQPATATVIPVAGKGTSVFLLAEQQTAQMGHGRLPREAPPVRLPTLGAA
jgi:hypothetical protein